MEKDSRDLKKRQEGEAVSVKEILKAAWARDLKARELAEEARMLRTEAEKRKVEDMVPLDGAILAEPEEGSLEFEIAQLQMALSNAEAEKNELRSDNERLALEVNGLQSKVSGLESTVMSLRDEIAQLRSKATTGNITVARTIQQTQKRRASR